MANPVTPLPKNRGIWRVVIAFIAIAVIFVGFLIYRSESNENQTRTLLLNTLNGLPKPAGCTESSRAYNPGGVDTNSTWSIEYTCDSTRGKVAASLQNNASYPIQYDALEFQTVGTQVSYTLIPRLAKRDTPEAEQSQPVTHIYLNISRVNSIAY